MIDPLPAAASQETPAPLAPDDPIAWRWRVRASAGVLSVGLIFMAAATWGAWVVHPSPGLTLLGIDLPEYVKFLPAVRSGQLSLTREVFYWPLVVLAVGLCLLALVTRGQWPRGLRAGLAVASAVCALALLPPAWSPLTFSQAEYRMQTITMLALLLFSFVTLLAIWRQDGTMPAAGWLQVMSGGIFVVMGLAAIVPLLTWRQVQPEVAIVYNHPLSLGWGGWALVVGAVFLVWGGILLVGRK